MKDKAIMTIGFEINTAAELFKTLPKDTISAASLRNLESVVICNYYRERMFLIGTIEGMSPKVLVDGDDSSGCHSLNEKYVISKDIELFEGMNTLNSIWLTAHIIPHKDTSSLLDGEDVYSPEEISKLTLTDKVEIMKGIVQSIHHDIALDFIAETSIGKIHIMNRFCRLDITPFGTTLFKEPGKIDYIDNDCSYNTNVFNYMLMCPKQVAEAKDAYNKSKVIN